MTAHDRIPLTGLLRKSPAPAGLFYGPIRPRLVRAAPAQRCGHRIDAGIQAAERIADTARVSTDVVDRQAGHFADRRFRERRRAWRRRVWWAFPLVVLPVFAATGLGLLLMPGQPAFLIGLGTGAAAAMVLVLGDSPPWHIERWRQGAEGEKRTAKALRPLTRRGWALVNDVDTGRGNIDHILVGPAGVFLIETKNLGGIVSVERGALAVRWREDPDDGYEARQVAPRARALAAQLAERLKESGLPSVWVQPIVVLWGDFPQGFVQSDGVAWVAGKRLASMLAERPTVFSKEKSDEVMAVLRSSLRSWSELGERLSSKAPVSRAQPSSATASPCPTPMQSVATPQPPPRRRSS